MVVGLAGSPPSQPPSSLAVYQVQYIGILAAHAGGCRFVSVTHAYGIYWAPLLPTPSVTVRSAASVPPDSSGEGVAYLLWVLGAHTRLQCGSDRLGDVCGATATIFPWLGDILALVLCWPCLTILLWTECLYRLCELAGEDTERPFACSPCRWLCPEGRRVWGQNLWSARG